MTRTRVEQLAEEYADEYSDEEPKGTAYWAYLAGFQAGIEDAAKVAEEYSKAPVIHFDKPCETCAAPWIRNQIVALLTLPAVEKEGK